MLQQSSNIYGPSTNNTGNDGDSYTRSVGGSRNQFVTSIRCCNIKDSNLRRMPITSSNELPYVSSPIGHQSDAASISYLYDTGGV